MNPTDHRNQPTDAEGCLVHKYFCGLLGIDWEIRVTALARRSSSLSHPFCSVLGQAAQMWATKSPGLRKARHSQQGAGGQMMAQCSLPPPQESKGQTVETFCVGPSNIEHAEPQAVADIVR